MSRPGLYLLVFAVLLGSCQMQEKLRSIERKIDGIEHELRLERIDRRNSQ